MGFFLVSPSGVELDLSSPPFYLLAGAQGIVFPNVAYASMRNPQGGEIILEAWRTGRKIDLPVWVQSGFSASTYRGNLQRLIRAISRDPRNPSWLVYRRASNRKIPVALRKGAGWADTPSNANDGWAKVVLQLYSPTGAWEDDDYTQVVLGVGEAKAFLPTFPFQLTVGTIAGSGIVYVDGDLAFPKWEVKGAASAVYLTNDYTDPLTGEEIEKACEFPAISLADGDTLVVDADPNAILNMTAVQIVRADGNIENAWSLMSKASEIWHLVGGNNTVTAQTLGSDENTSVTLFYKALHAAPWTEAE